MASVSTTCENLLRQNITHVVKQRIVAGTVTLYFCSIRKIEDTADLQIPTSWDLLFLVSQKKTFRSCAFEWADNQMVWSHYFEDMRKIQAQHVRNVSGVSRWAVSRLNTWVENATTSMIFLFYDRHFYVTGQPWWQSLKFWRLIHTSLTAFITASKEFYLCLCFDRVDAGLNPINKNIISIITCTIIHLF